MFLAEKYNITCCKNYIYFFKVPISKFIFKYTILKSKK